MKKTLILFPFLAVIAVLSFTCNSTSTENSASISNNLRLVSEKKVTNDQVIHLTSETFKEKVFNYDTNTEWKYNGDLPCIVDFYADWCGPCKRIAPVLEKLAKEYEGKIVIYKVNTESERELASAFGIRSIPTLLFCPVKGQPQMAQGALPKEKFKEVIETVLIAK